MAMAFMDEGSRRPQITYTRLWSRISTSQIGNEVEREALKGKIFQAPRRIVRFLSSPLQVSFLIFLSYCGFEINPAQAAVVEKDFQKRSRAAANAKGRHEPPTIPVYFHIVTQNNTVEGGHLTYVAYLLWYDERLTVARREEHVNDAVERLNEVFVPIGFNFELAGTQWIYNQEWFNADWMDFPENVEEP